MESIGKLTSRTNYNRKYPRIYHKYNAFYDLIDSIKSPELLNKYYSQIETQFLALVDGIDKLSGEDKYDAFSWLLKVAKITRLMKKHFLVLLGIFPKLPDIDKLADYHKQDAYSHLIKAIKGTDLENETVFKKWKEKNPTFKIF